MVIPHDKLLTQNHGICYTLLLILLAIYPEVVYFTYLELMDDLYPLGDFIIPQIDNSTNPCVCVCIQGLKKEAHTFIFLRHRSCYYTLQSKPPMLK